MTGTFIVKNDKAVKISLPTGYSVSQAQGYMRNGMEIVTEVEEDKLVSEETFNFTTSNYSSRLNDVENALDRVPNAAVKEGEEAWDEANDGVEELSD